MEFLDRISSSAPLPAGGAAVAYSLALAVGLIYKVNLLEIRRESLSPGKAEILHAVERDLGGLSGELQQLIERDADTFSRYAEALAGTDPAGQKKWFKEILDINFTVLEKGNAALDGIRRLQPITPRRLKPNLQVAAELVIGSVNGTVHLARENLRSIRSTEKRARYEERLKQLQHMSRKQYDAVIGAWSESG